MKLTTQQAAERLGKSRTAVWRAIKSGKLSAERTEAKDFLIDAAELERYASNLPLVAPVVTPNVTMQQSVTSDATNRTKDLELELATLRERTAQQEKRLREYEAEAEELRADKRTLRDQVEATTRLLTDQRERRSFWERLWQRRTGKA
jgi:excisionase family DNA binding protein